MEIAGAPTNRAVVVFGAYGHTGRFVVAELRARGWTPVLSGRDAGKLELLSAAHGGLEVRAASLESPAALDQALRGAAAVINAAGPFALTAAPVIEAALRVRIPYLDVAAEPDVVAATFERYAGARAAAIAPAVGFFGGLGDLLATAALGDWPDADEVCLAYALSSWRPTLGTRATIETAARRRAGRRLVFANHGLELRADEAPAGEWTFPAPIGTQPVVQEFTTADCITLSSHLRAGAVRECMTLAPLADLSQPDLAPPAPADASGRSAQTFLVEAVVRRGGAERRAVASGRDIYAVTAPLVVEAARRLIESRGERTGVVSAGQLGARNFLSALAPEHLALQFH